MSRTKVHARRETVIVRSMGDEPRRLHATDIDGTYVIVESEDGASEIGLPRTAVHYYDERLWEDLIAAYEAGDRTHLRNLWQKARRIEDAAAIVDGRILLDSSKKM